ncbi:MAG: tRNA pseudouridine(38-40) synthase TruA [Bdellovibrionales bacterium RIFCSPHIGHO2_01_FULL_40_29]|nr:MAG: tRNA pseudouridine(38-40) synthase TruA [Bdellovibrionales bacterium RIFCSPHIGHO2_01_FULL_40_29]OFZ35411.1 MAG: tRNA pseudouridine(38-40) synthase TruA [Bdellovibrionales bacterium RIFCSPHIGHO2_02_FULL_40_15]
MTRIKFIVSYDGTGFCGWQKQNHEKRPSVCQTLEEALEKLFGHKILLSASGRTDAGVHALNQVCHFDTSNNLIERKNWDMAWALRRFLPDSIVVKRVWIAPERFHSTISAERKTYKYLIFNAQRPSPVLSRYAGWVRRPLNLDHLNQTSQFLLGFQDFKSFQSIGTEVRSTNREIFQANWRWKNRQTAEFSITGSGFLKQMVRNIVGTQLFLEQNDLPATEMKRIIDLKDRKFAGPAAEPQGLYLFKVYYPQDLDNECREL